ncbi:ArsR/SmtB family transcription factor [Namhaeicola litoreus]|uniref:ArsR/SmtB family transcription factor n=1 Tax=Namhaeicola litoreus TaxID=1052145 RepID=A0ABW3Y105_9FLAO
MGSIKSEIYTDQQNVISSWAKVLGHPARIGILQHLLKINACICGDLVEEIGLAQATISQHLKELKNMGLIQGKIEGTSVCYCINEAKWTEMKKILTLFLEQNTNNKTTCC